MLANRLAFAPGLRAATRRVQLRARLQHAAGYSLGRGGSLPRSRAAPLDAVASPADAAALRNAGEASTSSAVASVPDGMSGSLMQRSVYVGALLIRKPDVTSDGPRTHHPPRHPLPLNAFSPKTHRRQPPFRPRLRGRRRPPRPPLPCRKPALPPPDRRLRLFHPGRLGVRSRRRRRLAPAPTPGQTRGYGGARAPEAPGRR